MAKSSANIVYEIDASRSRGKSLKIMYPTTEEEIQAIIKDATDIVPRGSGTNLVNGSLPNNSVVVEMRGLNKLTHFDQAKKTVIAEAGITLKELNEKLHAVHCEFPLWFNEQSTIGSMIAYNTVGEKSMRLGTMKEWIEEIEFINGRGELIKLSRADLSEVCGMEGTTGIIIRAKLKLLPLSKKSFSLFQSDALDEIISIARRLKQEPEVVMLKLYAKKTSELYGLSGKYHLIIGFDSERGKIPEHEAGKIISLLKNEYFNLYKKGYYESQDGKVFYDKLKEFMNFCEELGAPYIADLGTAIINPFFKPEEHEKIKKTEEFLKKIGAKKGRYGIGMKRKYLLDDLEKKIILRIKKRHDPFAKFNYGKLIDVSPASLAFLHEEHEKKSFTSSRDKTEDDDKIKLLGEEKTAQEFMKEIRREEKDEVIVEDIVLAAKFEKREEIPAPQTVNEMPRARTEIVQSKPQNDLIKNIMTNNFMGKSPSTTATKEVAAHAISPEPAMHEKKTPTSKDEQFHLGKLKETNEMELRDEQDLINSIMMNKFTSSREDTSKKPLGVVDKEEKKNGS
jgi:FAD/FMN-containing dehydrogenase